eukprot:Protomagalhaensia_sp_Gyna_25__4782@NODE_480_length_3311_cov_126_330073_g372_i0_p1_GENE_NODE_480_length_3311_cov_126_330073_g372_i0NODE_480_length_3311_cov_126_330073_g372_i0_p1_ORF_typecomplete_len483_score64_40_NODE_480_length_3311_cov_126_330073_g372_i02881736
MLYLIKHALEQRQPPRTPTAVENAVEPCEVSERPPSNERFTFEALKNEVRDATRSASASPTNLSPADSFDDALLVKAVERLPPEEPRSKLSWTKIKEALERRREATSQAVKMQAAAADIHDSLRNSVARLTNRYVRTMRPRKSVMTPETREAFETVFRDVSPRLCAGSVSSIPIFPFMAIHLIPADGWPSTRADSWTAYRRAVLAAPVYYGLAAPGLRETSCPPFPTCDFLPNLSQDWKDLHRDSVLTAGGLLKGSEFKSYCDMLISLLFQDDLGKTIAHGELRRRLIRTLMVTHFLSRTFSGALIYYLLDQLFSARATMDGSPATARAASAPRVETHLVPRSLEALPIELYLMAEVPCVGEVDGPGGPAVRGTSALVFGLDANKSPLAILSARVALDIRDLNAFGSDMVIDRIGDLIGVKRVAETFETHITEVTLQELWPSQRPTPPGSMESLVIPPTSLAVLTAPLKVLVTTRPRIFDSV